MEKNEYDALARAINTRNSVCEPWRKNVGGRIPSWWGELLSSIVLGIGPGAADRLKYVSSKLSDGKFQIVVIADSRVLIGFVADAEQDRTEFDLKVYALEKVTSVGINAGESYFGDGAFSNWPGELSVTVVHPDFEALVLPVADVQNSVVREDLLGVLPVLLAAVK